MNSIVSTSWPNNKSSRRYRHRNPTTSNCSISFAGPSSQPMTSSCSIRCWDMPTRTGRAGRRWEPWRLHRHCRDVRSSATWTACPNLESYHGINAAITNRTERNLTCTECQPMDYGEYRVRPKCHSVTPPVTHSHPPGCQTVTPRVSLCHPNIPIEQTKKNSPLNRRANPPETGGRRQRRGRILMPFNPGGKSTPAESERKPPLTHTAGRPNGSKQIRTVRSTRRGRFSVIGRKCSRSRQPGNAERTRRIQRRG